MSAAANVAPLPLPPSAALELQLSKAAFHAGNGEVETALRISAEQFNLGRFVHTSELRMAVTVARTQREGAVHGPRLRYDFLQQPNGALVVRSEFGRCYQVSLDDILRIARARGVDCGGEG